MPAMTFCPLVQGTKFTYLHCRRIAPATLAVSAGDGMVCFRRFVTGEKMKAIVIALMRGLVPSEDRLQRPARGRSDR